MKRNGILWIVLLALIVPALVLSGCKKKKHHYDDEDDSSIEVSEERDTDISGTYMLDEESTRALFADEVISGDEELNFTCLMTLDDDNELRINFIIETSVYTEDIENTMNYHFEVSGIGTWNYDKGDRILVIEIKSAELTDFNFYFSEENELTDAFIAESGGMEGVEEMMREAILEGFAPDEICGDQEFKITELTDDGFYARTTSGEIQKVRFVSVE